MEKIDIIVPIFKGKEYIINIMNMVLENTQKCEAMMNLDIKLILVNDCPQDVIMIEDSKGIDISIIQDGINRGIHGARVKGLENSTADYILFLDQDDVIADNYILNQYMALKKNNADIVICNGYHKNRILYSAEEDYDAILDMDREVYEGNKIISPGQALIKRKSIPAIWTKKIMKKNGADDYFLWLLLLTDKNVQFIINRNILFTHVYHDNNLSEDVSIMDESRVEMLMYLDAFELIDRKYIDFFFQTWVNPTMKEREEQRKKIIRDEYILNVYELLLRITEKKVDIDYYLRDRGYKRIAIYGFGRIARRFLALINVEYYKVLIVDSCNKTNLDERFQFYFPEDDIPGVNVMIVTNAVERELVCNKMRNKMQCKVIEIHTFLNEILLNIENH